MRYASDDVKSQSPASADADVIRATLERTHGGAPGLLAVVSIAPEKGSRPRTEFFATTSAGLDAATRWAARENARSNVYFGCALLGARPEKGRGTERDMAALTMLWADGDYGTEGHDVTKNPDDLPNPADEAAVRAIVAASGLPEPTEWHRSGGGINPVWLLAEPRRIDTDRDESELIASAIPRILGAAAYRAGCRWDVGVGDLPRIMRLMGTVNRKTEVPRGTEVVPGSGGRVSWYDLAATVRELLPKALEDLQAATREKAARAQARTGVKPPEPRQRPSTARTADTGASPLDVFAEEMDWAGIFEPHGWTHVGHDREWELWLRPGDPKSPYSVKTLDHVAVVWSESAGLPAGAGQKLTKPRMWSWLNYGCEDTVAMATDVLRAAFGRNGASRAALELPPGVLARLRDECGARGAAASQAPRIPTQSPAPPAPPSDDTAAGFDAFGPAVAAAVAKKAEAGAVGGRGNKLGVFLDPAAPGERIRLNVNAGRIAEAVSERIGSAELSGFFLRDRALIRVPLVGEDGYRAPSEAQAANRIDPGPGQFQVITEPTLRRAIERVYDVGSMKAEMVNDVDHPDYDMTEPDESKVPKKRVFTWAQRDHVKKDVAEAVLSDVALTGYTPNLRTVLGVTHVPTLRRDGSVLDTPGYDAESGLLYLPEPGFRMDPVPDAPSAEELTAARDLIARLYAGFPFVHADDRANAYASLFTPGLRRYLGGNTPMVLFDATTAGTGKTLAASLTGTVYGMTLQGDLPEGDELRKRVVSILLELSAPVVVFDNLKGVISSSWLEGFLTSTEMTERVLGRSEAVTVTNDRLLIATGNNVKVGGDLRRRTVIARMDAGMERPETRTDFPIRNLKAYVAEHRAEILHAVLTLARGWIVAGAPKAAGTSDDFGPWLAGMGGLVAWAGLGGTVGGSAGRAEERMSEDDAEWAGFLSELHAQFGDRPFTARDVLAACGTVDGMIAPEALPGMIADKFRPGEVNAGPTKSLGRWMANREGRIAGGLSVTQLPRVGKHSIRFRVQLSAERAAREAQAQPSPDTGTTPAAVVGETSPWA